MFFIFLCILHFLLFTFCLCAFSICIFDVVVDQRMHILPWALPTSESGISVSQRNTSWISLTFIFSEVPKTKTKQRKIKTKYTTNTESLPASVSVSVRLV